jgi:hypothetical protein
LASDLLACPVVEERAPVVEQASLDRALYRDPIQEIRDEAVDLAQEHGLEPERVFRVMEKLAVAWHEWLRPSEEDESFLGSRLWCPPCFEDALRHLPAKAALELFEVGSPLTLARRALTISHLSDPDAPFHTLDELADLLDAYVQHRQRSRDLLVTTGYPERSFARCLWLDACLAPLYPTKVPISVYPRLETTALSPVGGWQPALPFSPPAIRASEAWQPPSDRQGNLIYSYSWASFSERPETNGRTGVLELDPAAGLGDHGPTSACEEAPVMEGLPPALAEELDESRVTLLQLQLDVLAICARCLRARDAQRLWPEVLACLSRSLTAEDVRRCWSVDDLYDELRLARKLSPKYQLGVRMRGGLSALMRLVGHCEIEIRYEAFSEIKRAINLVREVLPSFGSYFQAVQLPLGRFLEVALDRLGDLDGELAAAWGDYRSRVREMITTELQKQEVALSVRLPAEQAERLRAQIGPIWNMVRNAVNSDGPAVVVQLNVRHDSGDTVQSSKRRTSGSFFRKEGEAWTLVYQEKTSQLKDSKGLFYIAYLLEHPGREIHARELQQVAEGMPATVGHAHVHASAEQLEEEGLHEIRQDDCATALTRADRLKYEAGLKELEMQVKEARQKGLTRRAADLQTRADDLKQRLRADFGLHGRARNSQSPNEKARKAVAKCIGDAIAKIGEYNEPLARHLNISIRRGHYLQYDPEKRVTWEL